MSQSSNPLFDIINQGLDHTIHKWVHYLPLYHKHFEKYINVASPTNKIIILEIGVQNGGSLDLWNKYFGEDNCIIYGVDIDNACAALERNNITIIIGDQGDRQFMTDLKSKIPQPDILIDDGGHNMLQQILTFDIMFEHVKPGGIFLCENTHTSYWSAYGGGYKLASTFMEYSKNLVDSINGYHHGKVDNITLYCSGMHFYDSIVFFDKSSDNLIPPPFAVVWPAKST